MSRLFRVTPHDSLSADEVLHRTLAASRGESSRLECSDFEATLAREAAVRRLEREFIEAERAAVAQVVRAVPAQPAEFVDWFESLQSNGPGQNDPLFSWLAQTANYRQMCWFLSQDLAGEAGFGDLVAERRPVSQRASGTRQRGRAQTVWQTLALSNLMAGLTTTGQYAYQSIGALVAVESTAPGRAQLVNAGLKRLGIGGAPGRHYARQAALDGHHLTTRNRQVLAPIVESDPRLAPLLAEGALMRLRAGARCFDRYREELWGL